jgi:hypothetical protein
MDSIREVSAPAGTRWRISRSDFVTMGEPVTFTYGVAIPERAEAMLALKAALGRTLRNATYIGQMSRNEVQRFRMSPGDVKLI